MNGEEIIATCQLCQRDNEEGSNTCQMNGEEIVTTSQLCQRDKEEGSNTYQMLC